jgi:hypothetical protein
LARAAGGGLAASTSIALATNPAGAAPTTVSVPTTSPYYSLLTQAIQPSVGYGKAVKGCTVKPEASCPGATGRRKPRCRGLNPS